MTLCISSLQTLLNTSKDDIQGLVSSQIFGPCLPLVKIPERWFSLGPAVHAVQVIVTSSTLFSICSNDAINKNCLVILTLKGHCSCFSASPNKMSISVRTNPCTMLKQRRWLLNYAILHLPFRLNIIILKQEQEKYDNFLLHIVLAKPLVTEVKEVAIMTV